MPPNGVSTNGANGSQPQPPPTIQVNPTSSPQVSEVTEASNASRTTSTSQNNQFFNGLPATPQRHEYQNQSDLHYKDGYDSDGHNAPWLNNNRDINDLIDDNEPSLPLRNEVEAAPEASTPNPNPTPPPLPTLTEDQAKQLKVKELKDELKKRGLTVSGQKSVLLERLIDAIRKNIGYIEEGAGGDNDGGRGGGGGGQRNQADPTFDVGSYWELLPQDGAIIQEDFTIDGGEDFYAPTVPQGEDVNNHVQKINYSCKFDRPVFTGKALLPKKTASGKRIKTRSNGEPIYEKVPCYETVPNIEWCKEFELDLKSHPAEWFGAFLPIRNKRGMTNAYASNAFTMENVLSWTNTKAQMQNAGLGGKYKDFTNFTLAELLRHFGLYLFQGLSPSPQIEMKFKSTTEDPVNGNDFIHRAFGSQSGKAERRHKHFKAFMACVNPTFPTPGRGTHVNWKVHPLLKHMMAVNKKAVHLGRDLSCDEQTIGFQGNHKDKQRITYKAEGDGFLADCICSDGYTFSFYFRHQPDPPERQNRQGDYSPLHRRVLSMISDLPDKNYTLGMDNLFNSAKLARAAKKMPARVMTHGVVRVSGRGVPKCVIQNEVSKRTEQEKVRHTVHAAVVKGDSICDDLVCLSVYDTKPVYILTNACTEICWQEKKKKIWSKGQNGYVNGTFHRLNVIDFYNHNMGNVDLADQLRNYYRYDTSWHRNRKWWWSIFWWGYQLLLTNAYIMYRKYHIMHCSTNYCSHYDFIKQVALTWIDPNAYGPNKKKRAAIHVDDDGSISRVRQRRLSYNTRSSDDSSSLGSVVTRNSTVNDKSLHPVNGRLKCRLDVFCDHHPISFKEATRAHRCQLHRWARGRDGKEVRDLTVLYCKTCNVSLCAGECWRLFHSVEDLNSVKETIANNK